MTDSVDLLALDLGTWGTMPLLTFSIRRYTEPLWGRRYLGPGRWSLDLGRTSFILELWFIRS